MLIYFTVYFSYPAYLIQNYNNMLIQVTMAAYC